ncbi:MAG: MBL fold metallo-hydrolase [Planctomycetaceae bacterium]|nr:MBL fold metallo-hydrolase [Planctomycetaceae bacterium]
MANVRIAWSRDERWLSNSWLVWDRPGGSAVLVDTGAPREPLETLLERWRLELVAVLCTHHHADHVEHNGAWSEAHGCAVCAHTREAELVPHLTRALEHGEELEFGELRVRALHVPGHTVGQLNYLVNGTDLFTGDTLFRNSIGGTRAPGHGTIEELRESIVGTLLGLPPETRVHPGHMESTTLGRERDHNPFLRAWLDGEVPAPRPCTAYGQPATLLLLAADYDGGTKAWVRFADGTEDVVPGSRVQLPPGA